jgi:hypothetical protein
VTGKFRDSVLKVNADCLGLTAEHVAESGSVAEFVKIVDNAAAVPVYAGNENLMAVDVSMADWKPLDEEHMGVDDTVAVAADAAEAGTGCVDERNIVDAQDETENDVLGASLTVQSRSQAQQAMAAQVSPVHFRPATIGR